MRTLLLALVTGVVVLYSGSTAYAQLVARYRTRLSQADHVGSRGTPLRTAAAVIQQDRANYHRLGRRDPEDQPDPVFQNDAERNFVPRYLAPLARGVGQQILLGTPLVEITITGAPGAYRIEVTLIEAGVPAPPPGGVAPPQPTGGVIARYRTRLSAADHVGAQGTPLVNAGLVLQQDRANFHRYRRRDPEDQTDRVFRNAAERGFMPRYLQIPPAVAQQIMTGTPLVEVSVAGSPGAYVITVVILAP